MNILTNEISELSLFDHNKYSKWYFSLIEKAKARTTKPEYAERHHVIPFCISKSNAKSNIVHLTGREHFIAHLLLPKAVIDEYKNSMCWAIRKMLIVGNGQVRNVSSRTFEIARATFAKAQSERMKQLWADPQRRKAHSEKLRATLSTQEARELKRQAALLSSTQEIIAKRAAGHRGLKHSEETKQKMRDSYKCRMGLV